MATSSSAPTIIDLKLSFLRAQILALSSPLRIPETYRPLSDEPSQALRQRSIDAALFQLNSRIREHSKLVYSTPAQRHVAEQIDALYWAAGEKDIQGRGGEALEQGVDLAADNNIAKLPETWDEEGVEDDSSQARRYQELAENLRRLSERRKELKERVARYKALKDGLNPFENARESVQENLCTRDGEVERELEKMRLLMARVSGRIEGLPMRKEDEDEMDIDDNASGGGLDTIDEDAKLRALLDLV